jgi:1A family penicillin-binding protein
MPIALPEPADRDPEEGRAAAAAVPPATPGGEPSPAGGPALGEAARAFSAALRREGSARARAAGGGVVAGAAAAWAGMRAGTGLAEARGRAAVSAGQARLLNREDAGPKELVGSGPAQAEAPAANEGPASEGPAGESLAQGPPPARPEEAGVRSGRRRARRQALPGTYAIRRGRRLILGILAGLMVGAAAASLCLWSVMRDLPLTDILPPLEEPTLSITTAAGEALTTRGAYRAAYVALEEMPPILPEAVMAIEDRRFREHAGVDLRGISRALVRNVAAGGVVEGGSTITQQLVKILYLEPDRTISRKLQEVALATSLERQLGKDRVLELYLNSVYLGSGAYGMPAAAQTYFDKEVGALTLPEAAMLAATIQLPSQVNPLADLGAVQNRGALVLTLMAEQGRITPAERDAALVEVATLVPTPPPARLGSYFADWVLAEAADLGGESTLSLSATATLDPAMQARAERAVREVIGSQGALAGASQAAVVVMAPSGQVRAMVGGVDYEASQFNRATSARRQPGSTFKLFVFLAALTMEATPDSLVEDTAIEIDGWAPQNFDGRPHGTVTLREAFARSYNMAAVRLAQSVGIDNVILVARQLGIEGELAERPSLALGTSEVTLIDLTEAYAAVARGRAPVTATGLTAIRFGEEGATLSVTGETGVEPVRLTRTQGPMIEMLRAVVEDGTGRAAAAPGVVGGKTGTSQDSRDAWFVGFTEDLVVGVWVGNDDNSPMDAVTGGGLPAEIFRRVVERGAGVADAGTAEGGAAAVPVAAPVQCNVRACSRAYRSFDAATCTFQPFAGPRRLCTR